ncbi:MAG: hypothetical protein WCE30_05715 [Mycobacterium sp.]
MSTGRPALTNLNVSDLCAIAGGDPWKLNDELQAGDAGAINSLADAFHQAGFHAKESDDEFTSAKKQFTDAWNHNGSEHPINESQQVQKATAALAGHQDQLSKIAVDLEQIAASLAIAQRTADAAVAGANNDLEAIDQQISKAKAANLNWLDLELEAAGVVKGALGHIDEARGGYLAQLHGAETAMAAAGFVPDALDTVDAAPDEAPAAAASAYDKSGQRSKDQAMVDKAKAEGRSDSLSGIGSPGHFTQDEMDAEQRLIDYNAVQDPAHNVNNYRTPAEQAEGRRLAGERLSDYNMVHSTGPVPKDPVLGGDARSRAQARLNLQREYETNPPAGMHVMMTDDATRLIDQQELNDRANVLTRVQAGLQQAGMTPQGAAQAAEGMAHGIIPGQLLATGSDAAKALDASKDAFRDFAKALPTGMPTDLAPSPAYYSAADIDALKRIGGRLGVVGSALDVGIGLYEIYGEDKPAGEVIAKGLGGFAGAYELAPFGAEAGATFGPVGAFTGALLAGAVGAYGGEYATDFVMKWMKG